MFLQCGRWMGEQLAPSNQDRYADTRYAMNIHDVAPGTSFPLAHSSQAYLWANNTSFRAVVTTEWDDRTCTLEISEVAPSSSGSNPSISSHGVHLTQSHPSPRQLIEFPIWVAINSASWMPVRANTILWQPLLLFRWESLRGLLIQRHRYLEIYLRSFNV